MSPFHFRLSAAKNLTSFQLLPASMITDLLQLFLGLPLLLFPWEFQDSALFGVSPSSFLNVWPIHLNFRFLISTFISSFLVTFHRSLLKIIFVHRVLNIYLIHLFTKNCFYRLLYFSKFSMLMVTFRVICSKQAITSTATKLVILCPMKFILTVIRLSIIVNFILRLTCIMNYAYATWLS